MVLGSPLTQQEKTSTRDGYMMFQSVSFGPDAKCLVPLNNSYGSPMRKGVRHTGHQCEDE